MAAQKAVINPALAELQPLVGHWQMELYNAEFLGDRDRRITGSIDTDWIEDGAALRIRQGDPLHTPAAVWIIGRDDGKSDYAVLYADDRGVSRIYEMSFGDALWRMWRDTPEFSQRFEGRLDPDARTIRARWEKSADQGATWEHDFNIDYTREQPSNPAQ